MLTALYKCRQKKIYICQLSILNGSNILTLFDIGPTVNFISEDIIKNNDYLSRLPVRQCPQ